MALAVRIMDYFYLRIRDESGKAYELLAALANEEINLLAFSAVPYGDHGVELTVSGSQRKLCAAGGKIGMAADRSATRLHDSGRRSSGRAGGNSERAGGRRREHLRVDGRDRCGRTLCLRDLFQRRRSPGGGARGGSAEVSAVGAGGKRLNTAITGGPSMRRRPLTTKIVQFQSTSGPRFHTHSPGP